MKYFFTVLAGLMVVISCQNTTSQNDEGQVSEAVNKTIAVPNNLKELYSPNSGVLRGIHFSSSKNQIINAEASSTSLESGSNELKYSIDLNTTDFADIAYFFDNNELQKIQVDVFGEDELTSDQFYNDIVGFFNEKYKTRKSIWEGSEGGKTFTVFAKQVKNGVYIVYELI